MSASEEVVAGGQILDALRDGTVEACHADANSFVDRDPVFAFFGALPFGLTPGQQEAWLRFGGGLQRLNEAVEGDEVSGFPAGGTGVQMGGWFRRELKAVTDLAGLKLRAGGFNAAVLAKLGAVPQRLADRDVLTALGAGRIDGLESTGPYDDEKQGLYKAARYYFFPMGPGDGNQFILLVGRNAWTALPPAYRAAFGAACAAAGVGCAPGTTRQPEGASHRWPTACSCAPREIARAGFLAADEVYAETLAGNDAFRQIFSEWKAFRDEQVRAFGPARRGVQASSTAVVRRRPHGSDRRKPGVAPGGRESIAVGRFRATGARN
ncbi:MAG: ABC transporter substrate-binding protein [Betaproteobacteria bacterium]|nr:ABC transporter substrate-binding protein [Betaproteobacteria bacterium]